MSTARRDIRRKRQVLDYAERIGNIRKACPATPEEPCITCR